MSVFTKTITAAEDATAAVHLFSEDQVTYLISVAGGDTFVGELVMEYAVQADTPFWRRIDTWSGSYGAGTIASGTYVNDVGPNVFVRIRCRSYSGDNATATLTEVDTIDTTSQLIKGRVLGYGGSTLAEFREDGIYSGRGGNLNVVCNQLTASSINVTGDGVLLSDYLSVAAAVTALGGNKRGLIIDASQNVSENTTVPENITLKFTNGNILTIDNGFTLTIQGDVQSDGIIQIFDDTPGGSVVFDGGSIREVYPEWWGATPYADGASSSAAIQSAVDAVPSGGIVRFTDVYLTDAAITITKPVEWHGSQNGYSTGIVADTSLPTTDDMVAINTATATADGIVLIRHIKLASLEWSITGATKANPCVVTIPGHSFSNGEKVRIDYVGGMTELNGNLYTVANKTSTTIELSGVDSSSYGTFTSGGSARAGGGRHRINVMVDATHTMNRLVVDESQILCDGDGYAIFCDNEDGDDPIGPYHISIRDNKIRQGIKFLGVGDSVEIHGNIISGPNRGIWIKNLDSSDGFGASSNLRIIANNITSYGGAIKLVTPRNFIIEGNNIEQTDTDNFLGKTITGITKANPAVVTAASHGFSNEDYVFISGVHGMLEVNGRSFVAAAVTTNTFELESEPYVMTFATRANPCVVTAAGHGFSDGDKVRFYSVSGMTELNGNIYTVANSTATNFELSGVDSSAYTTYTSGGYARASIDSSAYTTYVSGGIASVDDSCIDVYKHNYVGLDFSGNATYNTTSASNSLAARAYGTIRNNKIEVATPGYGNVIKVTKSTDISIDQNYLAAGSVSTYADISGITQANPAVVTTSTAHGLTTGERVYIAGVSGMGEVNNLFFIATVLTTTTFQLTGINSTGYGAYTADGQVTRPSYWGSCIAINDCDHVDIDKLVTLISAPTQSRITIGEGAKNTFIGQHDGYITSANTAIIDYGLGTKGIWKDVAFSSGYDNYSVSFASCQYMKKRDGTVEFVGALAPSDSKIDAGDELFIMPVGYRTDLDNTFICPVEKDSAAAEFCVVRYIYDVTPGAIWAASTITTTTLYMGINNISYYSADV